MDQSTTSASAARHRSTVQVENRSDGVKYHLVFHGKLKKLTGLQLKQYLENISRVPSAQQELYHHGALVEDDMTGAEMELEDGSIIQLHVRGRDRDRSPMFRHEVDAPASRSPNRDAAGHVVTGTIPLSTTRTTHYEVTTPPNSRVNPGRAAPEEADDQVPSSSAPGSIAGLNSSRIPNGRSPQQQSPGWRSSMGEEVPLSRKASLGPSVGRAAGHGESPFQVRSQRGSVPFATFAPVVELEEPAAVANTLAGPSPAEQAQLSADELLDLMAERDYVWYMEQQRFKNERETRLYALQTRQRELLFESSHYDRDRFALLQKTERERMKLEGLERLIEQSMRMDAVTESADASMLPTPAGTFSRAEGPTVATLLGGRMNAPAYCSLMPEDYPGRSATAGVFPADAIRSTPTTSHVGGLHLQEEVVEVDGM